MTHTNPIQCEPRRRGANLPTKFLITDSNYPDAEPERRFLEDVVEAARK